MRRMMTDHAARRRTEKSVMTGNVSGDTANHRSFDAAFGLRRSRRQRDRKRQGRAAEKISHRVQLRFRLAALIHRLRIRSAADATSAVQRTA